MILFASCISSLIEVIITHPIDYIKTQKQKNKNFIVNPRNIKVFYTGTIPRLIGSIPMRYVFWNTQTNIKNYLNNNNIKHPINFLYIGGGTAFCQTLIDSPIEIMKIKLISKKELVVKDILNYKGFMPNLYRNSIIASTFCYFCYQNEKTRQTKFLAGLLGGVIGSIISQPFDYIKTVKQSPYIIYYKETNISKMNTLQIIQFFIQNNYKQLFRGGYYRTLISGCSMSIGFVTINFINDLFKIHVTK